MAEDKAKLLGRPPRARPGRLVSVRPFTRLGGEPDPVLPKGFKHEGFRILLDPGRRDKKIRTWTQPNLAGEGGSSPTASAMMAGVRMGERLGQRS